MLLITYVSDDHMCVINRNQRHMLAHAMAVALSKRTHAMHCIYIHKSTSIALCTAQFSFLHHTVHKTKLQTPGLQTVGGRPSH